MSRKKIKYIHLFVWLFAIFANLPYSNIGQKIPVQQAVTYLFAFLYLMVVFYIFYLFIVPEFLEKKKMTMFFAVSFGVVLVMPFFGYTILFFIKAVFEHSFSPFLQRIFTCYAYERILPCIDCCRIRILLQGDNKLVLHNEPESRTGQAEKLQWNSSS